ncbi:MAG: FHA domain-containing protein, partial [Prevotellaceae bacterium]|nr:FHA domain-containing protein [Prevotellaceae bacterium]
MKVITIGRKPENSVVINDPLVSRHHLQIIQDDSGNFRLADFGSKNGTFVNGKRISGEVR